MRIALSSIVIETCQLKIGKDFNYSITNFPYRKFHFPGSFLKYHDAYLLYHSVLFVVIVVFTVSENFSAN